MEVENEDGEWVRYEEVTSLLEEVKKEANQLRARAELAEQALKKAIDLIASPSCEEYRAHVRSISPEEYFEECQGKCWHCATIRAEKAEANYKFMVERAADEKLDGYRKLGTRAAAAEEERDKAIARAETAEQVMQAVQALHNVAIKERDLARMQVFALKSEIEQLQVHRED